MHALVLGTMNLATPFLHNLSPLTRDLGAGMIRLKSSNIVAILNQKNQILWKFPANRRMVLPRKEILFKKLCAKQSNFL